MVFFTCNNCGDSVKKPSVLKHYGGMCRKPINLTCIDCCKDFDGSTYDQHTRCVTEEEKYSAKGFVSKPPSNKQEIKQQNWIKLIQSIADSDKVSSKDELNLLQFLSKVSNVPRKKVKFMNFICNCAKKFRSSTAENVWQLIEREQNANSRSTGNNNDTSGIMTEDSDKSPTKSPKKDKITSISLSSDEIVNSTSVSETTMTSTTDQRLLSKKERKALKKKMKYESEIKDIENEDPETTSELNNETNAEKKNKKKRKQRPSEGESESEIVTMSEEKGKTLSKKQLKAAKRAKLNSVSEPAISNGDSVEESRGCGIETKEKKKKKKKGTHDENLVVLENPPLKDSTAAEAEEVEVPAENTKFDWETIIVDVLGGRKDKQLSVKRLRKKVIAEYVARKNGGHVPDNILAKFNKKVQKIPSVKIIRDVAILKVQ